MWSARREGASRAKLWQRNEQLRVFQFHNQIFRNAKITHFAINKYDIEKIEIVERLVER